jgi:hypothetical protein
VLRSICFLILLSLSLSAQTVSGLLSGDTVPGARVKVTNVETAKSKETTADAAGRFQILTLTPGEYTVEVAAAGFQTLSRPIAVALNQEIQLHAPLVRSGEHQQVEVRALAPLLKTESAAIGGVIANQQITDLPLDGRNYYELSLLLPGVFPAAPGSAGSVRGDFSVNINGAREDANNFSLDGVYNGDPKLNGSGITSPVDGIREFEVATSGYDASFSRNAGGQVNVALKSGSNAVHGTAYEFLRNAGLDARNYFAPAGEKDPRYQRNQFGLSLGGPVRKDRTFFFADYEGRRAREGFSRRTNVPTALERIGDFSQSNLYAIDLYTQMPFPGNKIPTSRLDPIGLKIAALYPLPNRTVPGQNYVAAPIGSDDSDNTDVRLDHSLTSRDDLMVRYSFARRDLFEPYAGSSFSQVPGYGNIVPRQAHNLALAETHVFSPSLINELRAGFNRVGNSVNQQNQNNDLNKQVGLPNLSTNTRDTGLTFLTVTGYSPLGDEYNNPQRGVTNTYQVSDQMTWSRGKSTYKFGGDFRRLQQNAFRDVQSRGLINFIGFTGNPLAELLTGMPAFSAGARMNNPQHLRMNSFNLFAQSTHRVTTNLTLTAGLRWEYNTVPTDLNPAFRPNFQPDRNNFGPRVGFAYSAGPHGTVIRGGYGLYFDQSSLAPSEGTYFNYPYFDLRYYFFSAELPLTLANPFPANYPIPTPPSGNVVDPNIRTPYIQQWSFGVQQQAGRGRVVEVGYVGSKGTALYAARDVNQSAPFQYRPDPRYQDIIRLESRANSSYHALQASVRQQFTRGLTFLGAYTWSKSIDDASGFFNSAGDPNFPQDSYHVDNDRGRSNFDARQRLTASGSWLLPSPSAAGKWLSGFSLNGILTLQTGRPFTVALPADLDNSGTGRANLGFGANDRPNLVGEAHLPNPTADRWFNTSAFAIGPQGTFGNAGRNILDGPGLASFNLSLLKTVAIRESLSLQLRAESFNLLNRTNLDLPNNFLGGAGFGAISTAQNPRHIQLGLKLLF